MSPKTEEKTVSPRPAPNATLKQAAAFLQVSTKTVLNMSDRKLLTSVRLGRRRLWRWTELEKLARHGTPVITHGKKAAVEAQ